MALLITRQQQERYRARTPRAPIAPQLPARPAPPPVDVAGQEEQALLAGGFRPSRPVQGPPRPYRGSAFDLPGAGERQLGTYESRLRSARPAPRAAPDVLAENITRGRVNPAADFRRTALGTSNPEEPGALGSLFALSGAGQAIRYPLSSPFEGGNLPGPFQAIAEEATRPINYIGGPIRAAAFRPAAGLAGRVIPDVVASLAGREAFERTEGLPGPVRLLGALAAGGVAGSAAVRAPGAARGGMRAFALAEDEAALRRAAPRAFEYGRGVPLAGETPRDESFFRGRYGEDVIPRRTIVGPLGVTAPGAAGGASRVESAELRAAREWRARVDKEGMTPELQAEGMDLFSRTVSRLSATDEARAGIGARRGDAAFVDELGEARAPETPMPEPTVESRRARTLRARARSRADRGLPPEPGYTPEQLSEYNRIAEARGMTPASGVSRETLPGNVSRFPLQGGPGAEGGAVLPGEEGLTRRQLAGRNAAFVRRFNAGTQQHIDHAIAAVERRYPETDRIMAGYPRDSLLVPLQRMNARRMSDGDRAVLTDILEQVDPEYAARVNGPPAAAAPAPVPISRPTPRVAEPEPAGPTADEVTGEPLVQSLGQRERVRVKASELRYRPELFQASDVDEGRAFSNRRVKTLVDGWDENQFSPPSAIPDPEDPSKLIVYRGHHRLEAFKRIHGADAEVEVFVRPVDVRDPNVLREIQLEGDASNFKTAVRNFREKVRTFERAAELGLDDDAIATRYRTPLSEVQATRAASRLGPDVIERVTTDGTLGPLAAELGAGMRRYGIRQEDAYAWFRRIADGSRPDRPTAGALRETVAQFGEKLRALPPGLFDTEALGGQNVGLLTVIDENAKLRAQLNSQIRAMRSAQKRVTALARSPSAEPGDEAAAKRIADLAQREATRLRRDLEANVQDATRAFTQARAGAAAPPSAPPVPPPSTAGVVGPASTPAQAPPVEALPMFDQAGSAATSSGVSGRPAAASATVNDVATQPSGASLSPRNLAPGESSTTRNTVLSASVDANASTTRTYEPPSPPPLGPGGKPILHAVGTVEGLQRAAQEHVREYELGLRELFPSTVVGPNVKESAERIAEKMTQRGITADQISDYLRARVVADDLDAAVAAIAERFPVVMDDAVSLPTGYTARHLQVEVAPGFTAELQVLDPRTAVAGSFTHRYYESLRAMEPVEDFVGPGWDAARARLTEAQRHLFEAMPPTTAEQATAVQRAPRAAAAGLLDDDGRRVLDEARRIAAGRPLAPDYLPIEPPPTGATGPRLPSSAAPQAGEAAPAAATGRQPRLVDAAPTGPVGPPQAPPPAPPGGGGTQPPIPSGPGAPKVPNDPFVQRAVNFVTDLLNVPRSVVSSGDLSGSARQSLFMAPRHRREWAQAFKAQVQSLGSETNAQRIFDEIQTAPMSRYRRDTSLHIQHWDEAKVGRREEQFASKYAGKLPVVEQTQRAYVMMLNKFRADSFDSVVQTWPETARTPERLEKLARYVNAATGRGRIPEGAAGWAAVLNAAFFSPRFMLSIPQRHLAALTTDPYIRNEVLKDIGAFYGSGLTLVGLAYMGSKAGILPVDVEVDRRSSDFGKIRVGPTRIDPWGGHQQFATLLGRIATGDLINGQAQVKSTASGEVYNKEILDVVGQWLKYKLSPVARTAEQLRTGKDVFGDPAEMDLRHALLRSDKELGWATQLLTPLFAQSIYEAFREGGTKAALITAPLSFFGVGASTYAPEQLDVAAREVTGARTFSQLPPGDRQRVLAQNPAAAQQYEQEALGRGGAGGRLTEVRVYYRQQQEAADQRLAKNELTRSQWRDQFDDRQVEVRGALAGIFGPGSKPEDRRILYKGAITDASQTPLGGYYAQLDGARRADGSIDFDKVEVWRGTLSEAENRYIDDNTGLGTTARAREYLGLKRQLRDTGLYQLRDTLWARYQQAAPELAAHRSYYDYRDALQARYEAAAARQGYSPGVAAKVAASAVARDRVVKAFTEVKNRRETAWIQRNPKLADQAAEWGIISLTKREAQGLAGVLR